MQREQRNASGTLFNIHLKRSASVWKSFNSLWRHHRLDCYNGCEKSYVMADWYSTTLSHTGSTSRNTTSKYPYAPCLTNPTEQGGQTLFHRPIHWCLWPFVSLYPIRRDLWRWLGTMALHLHDSSLPHRGTLVKVGGRSPDRTEVGTEGSEKIEGDLSAVFRHAPKSQMINWKRSLWNLYTCRMLKL